MMIMAIGRSFFQFQNSQRCFCIVMAGFILLLMVLYDVGCVLPVLNSSGMTWSAMWINFSSSTMI